MVVVLLLVVVGVGMLFAETSPSVGTIRNLTGDVVPPEIEHEASAAGAPTRAVLLFIGDGMGPAHRTAARWQAVGVDGMLTMDRLHVQGLARTGSANSDVTDSAAAATALATGVKTNNGMISQSPDGQDLTTIMEQAKAKGMAVGLVTTVQLAHATPAAFAAHVPDRNMMVEIAQQMLELEVDVLLGGGEDEFLPVWAVGCHPQPGERLDGRNLVEEAIAKGYTHICDPTSLQAIEPTSVTRLLGLFADEELSRPFSPSLAELTQTAISILSRDPDGFFLVVEGGQIDWAAHGNQAGNAIADTLGFDEAVAVGQAYASAAGHALLVVTADHETGGMTVGLTSSGLPGEDGPFHMPDGTPFYINRTTGGHTAADVPAMAQGPWSGGLKGTNENTHIHGVMSAALNSWLEAGIEGPGVGAIRSTYTFTASVQPAAVTLPLTYSWQASGYPPVMNTSGLTHTASFSWSEPGPKTISLTVVSLEGTATASHIITLYEPIRAGFTAAPVSGLLPLWVTFTNTSTGAIDQSLWDFGDGLTSTLQSPAHEYRVPGAYTVTLLVSGAGASDRLVRPRQVTVCGLVEADFTAHPTSGAAPLQVTFANRSHGECFASLWDLGDGTSTTLMDPIHTYVTPGRYTITLAVGGPGGTAEKTKPEYILVRERSNTYLPLVLRDTVPANR